MSEKLPLDQRRKVFKAIVGIFRNDPPVLNTPQSRANLALIDAGRTNLTNGEKIQARRIGRALRALDKEQS